MFPNFLYIGPGRAGSDWVTKNLQLHPEIFIPRKKGTRFFVDNYDNGLSWYEKFFDERAEKAIGEATVGYLHTEHSAQLIQKHLPDAKFIVSLRDPVDRAYSSYGRLTGVAKEGDDNYGISFENKIIATPSILDQGLYAKHLKRWFELFPRENFLILTFDEMKNDPETFLQKIYTFLGVDPDFKSPVMEQKLNSSATLSSKSLPLYYLYRALLRIDFFGLSKMLDSINRTQREKINPDTRNKLIQDIFLDDINELEQLIGLDLTAWKN